MADKNKNSKKSISQSLYSCIVCILSILLAIGVNLFASQLPIEATKLDTTKTGMHTISQGTKEVLAGVAEQVDIYFICQSGNENTTVEDMLERYDDLSENVTVEKIDPAVNPDFIQKYTEGTVADNSIIVASNRRSQIIKYSDIATYTAYKGESYLTDAIKYVTTDTIPVIYALSGHGETEIDSTLENIFAKSGTQLKTLNLITEGSIPEDADAVMIYGAKSDINESEKEVLADYLKNSGRLMLLSDYNFSQLTNIAQIMSDYGVTAPDGIVVEGATDRSIDGYPYYVLPEMSKSSDITSALSSGNYVLMPIAQAIETNSDIRSSIKITDLFTTSTNSYVVDESTAASVSGLPGGPFSLAVSIQEAYDDIDTRIVWFSTSYFLNSDMDTAVSGTNTAVFINAVNYLCGNDNAASAQGKLLSTETLVLSTAQSRGVKIIIIGIIPAAAIIAGVAVWLKRRNR